MKIKRILSLMLAFLLAAGLMAPGLSGVSAAEGCDHIFESGTCTLCGYSVLDSNWLAPDLAEGDYSMVIIPDMQDLVCYHPDTYYATIDWIAQNEEKHNIIAALNMGDMVNDVTTDTLTTDEEWAISVRGMEALENSGIAWMPMMGNHDKSDYFNQYYPYETFSSKSWFGGSYDEALLDHTYWFVTEGDREYLILSLGWAPEQEVLDWAKGIVEQYPQKSVILTVHAMVNKDGTFLEAGEGACPSSYISGRPNGDDIWEAFSGYENITLCLSGHISSMNLSTVVNQNGAGKDVWSMLVDAQDNEETDALGMLALLTFDAETNNVAVNWYSTRYDAIYGSKNQFTITMPHAVEEHACQYTATVTEPTCTEPGGTTYTCTICGNSYTTDETAALGHNYVDGVCTACGEEAAATLYKQTVANGFSCQDGAIFGGKAFLVSNSACTVYDMESLTKVGSFTLDGSSALKTHGNTTFFGSTYYAEGDKYPLLYVSLWNKAQSSGSTMPGTCGVYRITETDGTYSSQLVQIIKIGFTEDLSLWKSQSNDVRPYGSFTVDTDNDMLYAFVMRDAEPITRFFGFQLPGMEDGVYNETYGCNLVTLTAEDIEKQFDTPYMNYQQGACYYDGKIYSTESFISISVAPVLRVIDLETQKEKAVYNLSDYGMNGQACMLTFDPDTGDLYYSVDGGTLYKLTLHGTEHQYATVVTDPTCTTGGYTTYTCVCGDTYTADETAALGHNYVDGICTNCGDKEPPVLYWEQAAANASGQDSAIWNGYRFQVGSNGICKVYSMETMKTVGSLTLDGSAAITAHGNSISFGSTYYAEGDAYPLLYVSVWNQYKSSTDRMEGTCCVYRLTETDGVFSSQLVQVIKIGFTEDLTLWKSQENNGDVRPYGSFTVDTDNNMLYAYVMRDAEPATRFFGFRLPGMEDGVYNETYGCNLVTLTTEDIEKQFDTPYMNYQQGACYYGGKIYSTESFVSSSVDPVLRVIDLATQTEEMVYDLTDYGLTAQATMLTFDPDTGALYYGVDTGAVYKLTPHGSGHLHTFKVTDPTCTAGGYTTYTCACGDTYTADETAVIDHSYENGVCAVCGQEMGVARNTATGVCYATVSAAIRAAQAGETVQLIADTSETYLQVIPGVTLDLNGHTLTADYVVGFNTSAVCDSSNSAENTYQPQGLLVVDPDNLVLYEGNGTVPVYSPGKGGYIFVDFLFNSSVVKGEGTATVNMLVTSRTMEVIDLLRDGAADNDIQIAVRLTWNNATGTAYQDFVFNEDTIRNVMQSNKGTALDFGRMFYVNVTGLDSLEGVTATAMVIAGCNAVDSGATMDVK